MTHSRPDIQDLYRLAGQLERDQQEPLAALRERDRAIALDCGVTAALPRLLCWLDAVAPPAAVSKSLSEASAALLARLLALVTGFAAMAGFLLGSERALVNVFLFLALFVLSQLLLCLVAALLMWRSARGQAPTALPFNPARWILRRSLPDDRYLRELQPLLRLLLLRYGQELGALFTLAAALAFLLIPALGEFSFVWGSTFQPGAGLVQALMDALAWPWAGWLPAATVPPEVVAGSRFHPALVNLDQAGIESMRGWWPFLFLCLLCYALLPRLLLWGLSRLLARRLLVHSFVHYPGSELVLARMQAPLLRTQAVTADARRPLPETAPESPVAAPQWDEQLLLVDYGGALGSDNSQQYEQLLTVPPERRLTVGVGALAADLAQLQALDLDRCNRLLLVVKAWEPPMAELLDALAPLATLPRCTVLLLPLVDKPTPQRKVEDWRAFARRLPFASVDVQLLNRVAG